MHRLERLEVLGEVLLQPRALCRGEAGLGGDLAVETRQPRRVDAARLQRGPVLADVQPRVDVVDERLGFCNTPTPSNMEPQHVEKESNVNKRRCGVFEITWPKASFSSAFRLVDVLSNETRGVHV